MEAFAAFPLTSSQRPLLWTALELAVRAGTVPAAAEPAPDVDGDEEFEIAHQGGVAIYDGAERHASVPSGIVYLTTHRLLYVGPAPERRTLGVELRFLAGVQHQAGFMRSHAKIWCFVLPAEQRERLARAGAGAEDDVAAENEHAGRRRPAADAPYVRLTFREGGQATMLERLQAVLRSRPWSQPPVPRARGGAAGAGAGFHTGRAGVRGLLRALAEESNDAARNMDQAFTDLDALMAKARDMVRLAERLSTGDARARLSSREDSELAGYLQGLGVSAPVTRKSAGSLYEEQLAREAADVVRRPLEAAGGMLALTDVYCMVNRARGTQLVSPDDLVRACEKMEDAGLPLRLRRFPSGVLVLESVTSAAASAPQRVAEVVAAAAARSASAYELSLELGVSITVATERLLEAEQRGLLCRDVSLDGVRFWPNFFADPGTAQALVAAVAPPK